MDEKDFALLHMLKECGNITHAADRLYLTRVEHDYEGDTSFPVWNRSQWRLVSDERFERGEKYPYPFVIEVYERVK